MKKLKQIIAMYLAVIMCCLPVSNAVFAADISDGNRNKMLLKPEASLQMIYQDWK